MIYRMFQNLFLSLTFSIDSLGPEETCTATMSRPHSAGDSSRCQDMEWYVLITGTLYPNSRCWWNLYMSWCLFYEMIIFFLWNDQFFSMTRIMKQFFFSIYSMYSKNWLILKLWISIEIMSFTDIIFYGYQFMNWNTDWVYMYMYIINYIPVLLWISTLIETGLLIELTWTDTSTFTFISVLQNGSGDANDVWVVEVVGSPPGTVIQTAKSRLRFIHYHVRCLLHSHDKKLPKWYLSKV